MAHPVRHVGASNSNPNPATSQAESEKTVTPSAVQPSGTGASTTTNASSGTASVIDPIAAFTAAVTPLGDQLKAALPSIDPAVAKHHATVGQKQLQVMQMVSAMLRAYPLLLGASPDAIDAATQDASACTGLSQNLRELLTAVDGTSRLRLEAGWQVASGAITAARKLAPRNLALGQRVAAIDAVTAKGPRAEQAAHSAVTAQTKAAKADAVAAKANAKAAAKTAAATALQHGTGDATITQPAPSAPAPSTTAPSASALAATPGTPGSTIR